MLIGMLLCCGCGNEENQDKMSPLDYVIVKEEDIPSELLSILEEKKNLPFKITYEDHNVLYIATGYGERSSGGYSIQIKEAGVRSDAIYFKTELIGPKKEHRTEGTKSYPYIVIQTIHHDQPVVF